jgi:hypothetical protein
VREALGRTALKLLARIRALGVLPSEATYYHCLHALRRSGGADQVAPVFLTLVDGRARLRLQAETLAAAAHTAARTAADTAAVAAAAATPGSSEAAAAAEWAAAKAAAAVPALPPPLRPSLWAVAIGCEAKVGNTEAALGLIQRSVAEGGEGYRVPPDHYDQLFLRSSGAIGGVIWGSARAHRSALSPRSPSLFFVALETALRVASGSPELVSFLPLLGTTSVRCLRVHRCARARP